MTTPLKRIALEDVLIKHGLILESEKDQLLQGGPICQKKPLHSLLMEKGAVAEPLMAQALADQYDLPWNPLEDFRVDSSFFTKRSPSNGCTAILLFRCLRTTGH